MAAIDYRKLIDHLQQPDGTIAFVTVEVTTQNRIALAITSDRAVYSAELILDEGEAGAIFDGLGGALRALAVTEFTPADDPRIRRILDLCDVTEIRAGNVFSPTLSTEDIRAALVTS